MTPIDTIYKDFTDAASVLAGAQEVSLQIMLESNLRKTLLLSAASYFEYTLSREVVNFINHVTGGNLMVGTLVQTKAIARQYHTWFDWNKNNANKFFSLFGQEFQGHMAKLLSATETLSKGVTDFLVIGRERNSLVHSDYATYPIDKTPKEIYDLYVSANRFVSVVGRELLDCSENSQRDLTLSGAV